MVHHRLNSAVASREGVRAIQYDIVIVGAGHNGLTAAAYLARSGYRVAVFERRGVVGGCAVTEEVDPINAPGCRVSTASYIASMLSPRVIADLQLANYGLRMVACDPAVQAVFEDGDVVAQWTDAERFRAELQRLAPHDVDAFLATDRELKSLAARLQPFFLEPPPHIDGPRFTRWWDVLKAGRRFGGLDAAEWGAMVEFLTGSLGDFLDRRFESEKLKRLVLANSLYGKHGGPYQPGTAMGLLFHLLGGGEEETQGFQGHVIGGMGAVSDAIARAATDLGVAIHTDAPVAAINVDRGNAFGVTLSTGEVVDSRVVASNADPKRTLLGLVEASSLEPEFRRRVEGIRMAGPCAKVNYVLSQEPEVRAMPAGRTPTERALFTLVPTLDEAETAYHQSRSGRIPDVLWVDCVLASNVDSTLVPEGRHVLTCFVQYVPYHLTESDWIAMSGVLEEQVTSRIEAYAPGFRDSIVARDVITPAELERRFGLTEGNIFHGDIALDQLFTSRPIPGWSRYETPIKNLYLCGAGTHPGGGVTAAPGYNAARQIASALR